MDNINYTPKRLQPNIVKSNTTKQILNEDFDINNQHLFPNLTSSSVIKNDNNQSIINWNNISKNLSNETIKELQIKKNNKELQKNTVKLESANDNKIILEKIKLSYVDESGWTHIVKSNKPIYKEKKKKDKNTEDINKLIESVIKS